MMPPVERGQVYVTVEKSRLSTPVIIATVFGLATIVFFILTIVIPGVMKDVADPKYCVQADWIRRDEQLICSPGSKKDYIGRLNETDVKYVKYYRMKKADMQDAVDRYHSWSGVTDLSKGALIFPITTSNEAQIDMRITCKGKCDSVRFSFIPMSTFHKCNKTGVFDESYNDWGWKYQDFTNPQVITEILSRTDNAYYICIANHFQESVLTWNMTIHYTGYDVSQKAKKLNCTGPECLVESLETSERIIMEYLDPQNKGPEIIPIYFKSVQGSYAGVVIFAIIFVLCTIGCGVICVLFILQKTGKLNFWKFGKKNVNIEYGDDNGNYEAPLVPGQGGVSISKVTIPNDEL